MDRPELAQGADEVAALDLGALHVVPLHDGELVDRARGDVAAPPFDEAGDDLDVEDPAREKRLREDVAQVAARTEELRSALRVVDRQPEGAGDEGGADAPDVVPGGPAADRAAEEADARAEDHRDLGTGIEDGEVARQLGQRGGEVGIPETG